jgi:hypothetical protein
MAIKREVRNTYSALLKDGCNVSKVTDLISFYDDYIAFRQKVMQNPMAPTSFKMQLGPIKVPQYVEWLKKYLDGGK